MMTSQDTSSYKYIQIYTSHHIYSKYVDEI